MPTVKTQKRIDKLAGLVQVESDSPADFVQVMYSCMQLSYQTEEKPQPWVLKLRNRLQPQTLEVFDQIGYIFPLSLTLRTAKPRTIENFLAMLEAIPDDDFLDELVNERKIEPENLAVLTKIWEGIPLTEDELNTATDFLEHKGLVEHLVQVLPHWQDSAQVKRRFIAAFRDLYEAYFRHEVERIGPILENSANEVRSLVASKILPTTQLIEGITHGFTLSEDVPYSKIILIPSFYVAPYVTFETLRNDVLLMLYPARPEGMSVDSGSVDDERLLRQLKALSDKTRLEILRLLAKRPYYNQELADALKLTQPTISHHMGELRVAGLVRVELHNNVKQYSLYTGFADVLAEDLKNFLGLESFE